MDSATRYGSYVPVTTIGIAHFRTRDQRATNPRTRLQNTAGNVSGAPPMTDVGRRSADDLVLRTARCPFGYLLTRWTGSDARPDPTSPLSFGTSLLTSRAPRAKEQPSAGPGAEGTACPVLAQMLRANCIGQCPSSGAKRKT